MCGAFFKWWYHNLKKYPIDGPDSAGFRHLAQLRAVLIKVVHVKPNVAACSNGANNSHLATFSDAIHTQYYVWWHCVYLAQKQGRLGSMGKNFGVM
jgi:hypothetical protein